MAKDWRDWLVENPDIVHGKPSNENTRVLNKDILDFDTEGSKIKSKKFMDKFKFDPLGQFEKSFAEMAEEGMFDDYDWLETKSGMKNKWPIVDMDPEYGTNNMFGEGPRVKIPKPTNTNIDIMGSVSNLDILDMLDNMEKEIQRDYEALPFLEKLKYNKDYYTSRLGSKLEPLAKYVEPVAKPIAKIVGPLGAAYGALEYFKGSPTNEGEEEELRRMKNKVYNKAYRGPLSN